MRFDVTEPNMVNTQVAKQVPLTGANSVVYDQWTKVGQQASQLALDVFEKRDIAAANNYAAQKRSEMSRALAQYQSELETNSVDGFIGGRAINDLMAERVDSLKKDAVYKAPSDRAKAHAELSLEPIGTNAVLDTDKVYTKLVSSGSSRRLTEAAQLAAGSVNPNSTWQDKYRLINENFVTTSLELGNLSQDQLDEFHKKATRDIFERSVTYSSASIDSKKLAEDGLALTGSAVHSSIMDALKKGKSTLGVRNTDGTYTIFDMDKGVTQKVELPKEQYGDALVVDVGTGAVVYGKAPETPTRIAQAYTPDQYNKLVDSIYTTLAKKVKYDKSAFTDKVKNFSKALERNPDLVLKQEVGTQFEALVQQTVNNDQLDPNDKADLLLELTTSYPTAQNMQAIKGTRENITNSKETFRGAVKRGIIDNAARIYEETKKIDPDAAEVYRAKVIDPTFNEAAVEKGVESYMNEQIAVQNRIKADPVDHLNKTSFNSAANEVNGTLFNFGMKASQVVERWGNSPETLASVQGYYKNLPNEISNISGGMSTEIIPKSVAADMKKAFTDPSAKPSEILERINTMRVAMGDANTMKAFKQAELSGWGVMLGLTNSTPAQLKFIEAARNGGNLKETSQIDDAKKKEIKASVLKNAKVAAALTNVNALGGLSVSEDMQKVMENMALMAAINSPKSSGKELVNQVAEELLGDKELHSGTFGSYLFDKDSGLTSDELEIAEDNAYKLIKDFSIVIPESVEKMQGMNPLEQGDRYKASLRDSFMLMPVSGKSFQAMSRTKVNGVIQTNPIYVKDRITGQVKPLEFSSSDIKAQANLMKSAKMPEMVPMGAHKAEFSVMFPAKPKITSANLLGVHNDKVAVGAQDQVLMASRAKFETITSVDWIKKSQSIPTGVSKEFGEIPLEPYYPRSGLEGKTQRQLFGGVVLAWNADRLGKDADYQQYVKNGYKFKSGTPNENAEKIVSWYKKASDYESSQVTRKYEREVGNLSYLTPNQLRSVQELGWSEGANGAFGNKEIREAYRKRDAVLLEKALLNFSNYSEGSALNARGKEVLRWFKT